MSTQEGASWGGGGSVQWGIDDRWAISVEAARMDSDGRELRPVIAGIVFGPATAARIRPWVEAGAGYYRLLAPRALLRPGYTTYIPRQSVGPMPKDAVGSYCGIGLDLRISSHLGATTGVRFHNWVQVDHRWDGLLAARTGLSYRF